jgi:hypothetical protein
VTAVVSFAIVLLIVSDETFAITYNVASDAELMSAFLNAADGDTVLVAPGHYGVGDQPFEACITVRGMTGDPEDVFLEYIFEGLGRPVGSTPGFPVRLEGLKLYGPDSANPLLEGMNLAIEIRNCVIESFAPVGSGSVIRAGSSTILLENTLIENNIGVDASGGAFHLTDCEFTAQDCTFTRNHSNFSGGVFYMVGGSLDLTGCTFQPNYSIEMGSVLDLTGVSGTIAACSFTENETGSGGNGALRFVDCQDLTLTGSTISFNRSIHGSFGGMVILGSSAVTLEECVVLNNQAESPADGFLGAGSSVVFRCCELDLTQWQLEGTVVIDNENCPVPIDQHSFGSVKAMFR